MRERKIVLVIVEGPSDATALGGALSKVFAASDVRVEVMHCDVTLKDGSASNTICAEIGGIVTGYLHRTPGVRAEDILQIIHLVDTDGAYVPNGVIVQTEGLERTMYFDEQIQTGNKRSLEARNAQKRSCLKTLIRTNKILKNIPYHVYFMSCNLEHALHNKRNCTNREKRQLAEEFDDRFGEDAVAFKKFVGESAFSVRGEYRKSWEFIQQDVKSLLRHTNLGLCWNGEAGKS